MDKLNIAPIAGTNYESGYNDAVKEANIRIEAMQATIDKLSAIVCKNCHGSPEYYECFKSNKHKCSNGVSKESLQLVSDKQKESIMQNCNSISSVVIKKDE